ncbi:MAG: hypothetical protein RXR41_02875 [Candidatus Marsarchaeota archaeon]
MSNHTSASEKTANPDRDKNSPSNPAIVAIAPPVNEPRVLPAFKKALYKAALLPLVPGLSLCVKAMDEE